MKDAVLYIHGKGGDHWFHTEEQMRFLDEWIRSYESKPDGIL